MPKEHDFKTHYDPIIKHAEATAAAANQHLLKEMADKLAGAVQTLLMQTHDEQAALGASPQVLAVITDSITEYKKYHATTFV